MKRRKDRAPERRLIAGFAGAGVILFVGTLFVGFAARDIGRDTPSPVHVSPSASVSANASG